MPEDYANRADIRLQEDRNRVSPVQLDASQQNLKSDAMADTISILVVEDEYLILMDLADQLAVEGFSVYQAGNADDAIEMLTVHTDIRLVFTDVDMPGSMDGLKLAAVVRNRWPPVKIIVTSGHRAVELADMPIGSLFLKKPYAHPDLVASMRNILSI